MNTKAISVALNQDIERFVHQINGNATSKQCNKSVNALKALWNTFQPKIGKTVYAEKVLALGDFLALKQLNKLAAYHCYGHYLQTCFSVSSSNIHNKIKVDSFMSSFFADKSISAVSTHRALIGYASSLSFHMISNDPNFQSKATIKDVVSALKLLQLSMQVALMEDAYCWLVYNGTIHVHTICRKLMAKGLSSYVLDFLIWACVSMESSVALMTIKYLKWRSQLYVTTCQCFYDVKADAAAEDFARRGLRKVEELKEIERISTSDPTPETTFLFKQALMKLNVMVFKRIVFESRRKPKGVLRPKIKLMLRDIIHNHWPRTGVEKMLADMFRGRATQLLAINEALTDPNRRFMSVCPGAPETDDCSYDVFLELFFAGLEIISGGGGTKPLLPGKQERPINKVTVEITLMELASAESQLISLQSVVRFVQLAYNHENWELFDALIQPLLNELQNYPDNETLTASRRILQLFHAMSAVNPSRIKKKFVMLKTEELSGGGGADLSKVYKTSHVDDVVQVATILQDILRQKNLKYYIASYHDILVDTVLFLWSKCKNHFSRVVSSSFDGHKSIYNDTLFIRWMKILIITQRAIFKFDVVTIDPCVVAEVSLKLAFVLVCLTNAGSSIPMRSTSNDSVSSLLVNEDSIDDGSTKRPDDLHKPALLEQHFLDVTSFMEIDSNPLLLLQNIYGMLSVSLRELCNARDGMRDSQRSVADDSMENLTDHENNKEAPIFSLNVQAFHLELIYQHHYVHMLINKRTTKEGSKKQSKNKRPSSKVQVETFQHSDCVPSIVGKNDLSKAISLVCSVTCNKNEASQQENAKAVQNAFELLQKANNYEERLKTENTTVKSKEVCQPIPPPPILEHRGNALMVFRPAPFKPSCGTTVSSYSLFLRNAAGNNVKVRLSDTQYKGTGEQFPYGAGLSFIVRGLELNERYMAAVGAYNSKGELIGGSIGWSSKPILASNIFPVLLAYGYLTRAAYQANVWNVAKLTSNILWNHFVKDEKRPVPNVKVIENDHKLNLKSLKISNVNGCSGLMQRYLVESIFISVDIAVKEGQLFCDSICCQGVIRNSQIRRLNECEKLMIAMQIAGWLNDSHLCLQSIVQMYDLLTPVIYWKFPVQPAVEVLAHVFAGLQEVQTVYKNKRQNATTYGLQHMVSSLAYYIAKILVNNKKKPAALHVLDFANKFLTQLAPSDNDAQNGSNNKNSNNNEGGAGGANSPNKKQGQKRSKATKRRKPTKAGVTKTTNIVEGNCITPEQRALDMYTTKLLKEGAPDNELDLTGAEDAIVLNAVTSTLPPAYAYREVLKFKRRTHFLESFVGVLLKTFNQRLYECVLEWTKETLIWLTRRNDIILNKSTNDAKGIIIVASNPEEDRLKKFSASVVEYGKGSPTITEFKQETKNGSKVDMVEAALSETSTSPKGRSSVKNGSLMKKLIFMSTDEKKQKEAFEKIQSMLPYVWKRMSKRMKMRNVCCEEFPWRSQMNLVTAECHFNICLDKFGLLSKRLGYPNLRYDDNMMDVNWFSLSSSGALIVSWAGCMKNEANLQQSIADLGGKTVEHFPHEIHLVPTASRLSVTVRLDKRSSVVLPKPTVADTIASKQDDAKKLFIHNLHQSYVMFKRAMVLAHRGCNWVLLQNTCSKLLQSTCTVIMRICLLNNNIDTTEHDIPYTLTKLRRLIYKVFYTAADLLLDMMAEVKGVEKQDGSKDNMFGNIKENKGGSSLVFNPLFDENTFVDYASVKRVLMFAIEVLYYEEKWEKLCSIIARLTALSNDYFSESLLPILVYGQRCLTQRLDASNKLKPDIVFDPKTGVPLEVRMGPVTPLPIEVGSHIDPGYDLYHVSDDGLKYSIAPNNFDVTLNQLASVVDKKLYTSRLLEHSRFLLMSYLAGKQGVTKNEGKVTGRSSRVSFVASQIKPASFDPLELKSETFDGPDDLEAYPLPEEQLPVVMTSYERTIEMLRKTKQTDLLSQAMHELGNLMFHANNTRSAYRWWSSALDNILQTNDAQSTWKKHIDVEEQTMLRTKGLVERFGVWGCLLGGVVCTNIAKYILSSDVDASNDMCYLACSFYQSLLCTSLTHPSAYHRYSTYDIALDQVVNQVIPGLNLFSDPHRIHCGSLAASILWLAKYQVKRGCYLEVQPLLTLLHYLACVVCKDLSCALEAKLLRVQSLCALRDYEAAIHHFRHVINGHALPKPADVIRVKVKCRSLQFNAKDPLLYEKNYQTLMFLCNVRFNQSPYTNVYGKEFVNKVAVCQSNLLISIAELVHDLPSYDVLSEETGLESQESSKESLKDAKSQSKLPQGQQKKSRDKPLDSPPLLLVDVKSVQPDELKGKLIVAAETILTSVLQQQQLTGTADTSTEENLKNGNLELHVKCHLELSRIEQAKFHTMSATHHVYECLVAMNDVIEDPVDAFVVNSNSDIGGSFAQKYDKHDSEIDADMWLKCRLMLCGYLHQEDNAVGRLSGPTLSLVGRVGCLEDLLESALVECKMFNDSVTACLLQFLQIQVDLKCGRSVLQILDRLEELHKKIEGFWLISDPMMQLQFEVKVLIADLKALLNPAAVSDALKSYQEIEMFALNKLIYQGHSCDLATMLPSSQPYSNVNLKFLNNLVSAKVRLYRVKAIENTMTDERSSQVKPWMDLLDDIESCLSLIEQIPSKDMLSKIELTLLKGEIHRFLFEMNTSTLSACIDTFMEVLALVRSHTVDLSILRQCYNEIALAFSHMLKLKEKAVTSDNNTVDGESGSGLSKQRRSAVPQKPTLKPVVVKQSSNKETQRLCKGAWVCIRTAGVIAKAQRKSELIAGEPTITSLSLGDTAWSNLPSYVLEDLSGLEEASKKVNDESTKKYILKFDASTEVEITWVHLLNYVTHLRRHCSYSSLALGDFDRALVRIPLNCHTRALKLSAMMKFLPAHLSVFNKECCPILPTDIILSLMASLTSRRSSFSELSPLSPFPPKTPEIGEELGEGGDTAATTISTYPPQQETATPDLPTKQRSTPEKLGDRTDILYNRNPLQAGEYEMALQWFKPELSMAKEKDRVYMLAAMNSKPVAANSSSVTFSQVASLFHTTFNQFDCLRLHEELLELVQSAEADLAMEGYPSRSAVAFTAVTAAQMVARGSAVQSRKQSKLSSPLKSSNQKPEKEEELEGKMMPVILNLAEFLRSNEDTSSEQVPVFDATWTNLLCLESMFNPSLGHISRVTDSIYNWFLEHFNHVSRR